jgi:hypothetical protein
MSLNVQKLELLGRGRVRLECEFDTAVLDGATAAFVRSCGGDLAPTIPDQATLRYDEESDTWDWVWSGRHTWIDASRDKGVEEPADSDGY